MKSFKPGLIKTFNPSGLIKSLRPSGINKVLLDHLIRLHYRAVHPDSWLDTSLCSVCTTVQCTLTPRCPPSSPGCRPLSSAPWLWRCAARRHWRSWRGASPWRRWRRRSSWRPALRSLAEGECETFRSGWGSWGRPPGQAGGHGGDLQVRLGVIGGDLQVRLSVMGETSRSGWESLGGPLGQAGGHRTILTNGLVIQGLFTLYEMCYIDRI